MIDRRNNRHIERQRNSVLLVRYIYRFTQRGVIVATFFFVSGFAQASPSDECIRSAHFASNETGVPVSLLLAVSKVETGRRKNAEVLPWPWAINIRGTGQWLDSKDALLELALAQIAQGETRFDVGCFQLNYRWHGESFSSLDEMISPKSNALYAAKFLGALYKEFDDWTEAAGAYHSRTEALADKYKARLAAYLDPSAVSERPYAATNKPQSARRLNSYPLLKAATLNSRLGSLVPQDVQ